MTKLVRPPQITEAFPELNWPYKADGTYRLIKLGRLGCVRVGRNVYVTRELLEQFIASHVTIGETPIDPVRSAAAKQRAEARKQRVQP